MAKTKVRADQLNPEVATDAEVAAALSQHGNDANAHPSVEKLSNRGVPGGYAPLDLNGKLPVAAIPVQSVTQIMQTLDVDGGTF